MIQILKTLLATAVFAFLVQCSPSVTEIISGETGSAMDKNGVISNNRSVYVFHKEKDMKTCADLFNFIYFEGDELFFSFIVKEAVTDETVSVYYKNPATGKTIPAERIDIRNESFLFTKKFRVSGFSLLGSVMEQFFNDRLGKPLPVDAFCCRDIPFSVILKVRRGTELLTKEVPASFRVEYR